MVSPLLIAASKSIKLSGGAGLWGWVSVAFDSEFVESVARVLQSAVSPLQAGAALIDKQIVRLETASYRMAVIANQRQIIELLSTPGQGRGRR